MSRRHPRKRPNHPKEVEHQWPDKDVQEALAATLTEEWDSPEDAEAFNDL